MHDAPANFRCLSKKHETSVAIRVSGAKWDKRKTKGSVEQAFVRRRERPFGWAQRWRAATSLLAGVISRRDRSKGGGTRGSLQDGRSSCRVRITERALRRHVVYSACLRNFCEGKDLYGRNGEFRTYCRFLPSASRPPGVRTRTSKFAREGTKRLCFEPTASASRWRFDATAAALGSLDIFEARDHGLSWSALFCGYVVRSFRVSEPPGFSEYYSDIFGKYHLDVRFIFTLPVASSASRIFKPTGVP